MANATLLTNWRYLSTDNEEQRLDGVNSAAEARRLLSRSSYGRRHGAGGLSFPQGNNQLAPSVLENRRIIIGDDERQQVDPSVLPYRCVCQLLIRGKRGNSFFGTGFLIAKRCVITAGHCVFFSGQWASTITVVPGANGESAPLGKFIASRFRSTTGWTVNGDFNFDYGALLMEDDSLFKAVGGYLPYAIDDGTTDLQLTGYPLDKGGSQWKSAGPPKNRSKYRLYYEMDTVEGNSGSPVFASSGGAYTVIGLHTQGESPNWGLRVREEVKNHWDQWAIL